MAHHDDAPFADVLADVVADADTKAVLRRLLEQALQQLIEAELTAAIGAAPHVSGAEVWPMWARFPAGRQRTGDGVVVPRTSWGRSPSAEAQARAWSPLGAGA